MVINVLAIVQARISSTRLPGKVLKKVHGKTLIEILFQRLNRSKKIDKIILATSENSENDRLVKTIEKLGFDVFRGSENNVLDRYYQAAKLYNPNSVVRITGDCPLIDPVIVDAAINQYAMEQAQYLNNVSPPTYPDGMDIEIFSFGTLAEAWKKTESSHEREHVSSYIRNNDKFKKSYLTNENNYGHERLTVDEPNDLKVVTGIIDFFWPNLEFSMDDIMDLKKQNPSIFVHNKNIGRDEGSKKGYGQKLWIRAKHLIPGGNMLLSKRPEMFLPEHWPSYFSKAKGCKVWDLDGHEYIDMSIMGIGTNTLGYGHPEVDDAVRRTIDQGNMSTLNCPEEVYLAEKLIQLHPWGDMVRFARTGGEANAIAIRIARAASGKDKVAICGYHGWHDWYLSANLLGDRALELHLMPGLNPMGVPKNLAGTVLPFSYENIDELEHIVTNNDIGVIKMEVARNREPKGNFLQKVRQLATQNGIVLIFDECTSGFRETFGGLHKKYGVEPDMAIFGKTLGNGYAITSIIGRREMMESAQSTFISSTFWTERIGPSAALKTLEVMERERSWETITTIGLKIRNYWKELATRYGLDISCWGLPALTGFSVESENVLAYKTLITQEMLKKGFLAANSVYVCTEHKPQILSRYFEALDPIFGLIKECEEGRDIYELLDGPLCHSGFKRLN